MDTKESHKDYTKAFPSPGMGGGVGMDLRDWFASRAINLVLETTSSMDKAARTAYAIADAMMEARKK